MQGREERRDSKAARTPVHRPRGLPIRAFGGLVFAGAFLALGGCEAPERDPMEDMPMEEAMDRPMAEMEMDDETMGRMMGMSAEEHRRMMDEMAALLGEVEELQVAPVDEIRERMPAHLDRLDAVAGMLEEMAEAMREM